MLKKALLTLASIFLLWQSYKLLWNMQSIQTDSLLIQLLLAWLINMFITGIFAFAGFAFPTQNLLPTSYYKNDDPQKLKRVYKTLKVEVFRKFLLATFWRSKKQREKYFNGNVTDLSTLEVNAKKSEFGHLIPFFLVTLASAYLLFYGKFFLAIFCMFWNILGNLYPIILQRHHRMRIELILKRQHRFKK